MINGETVNNMYMPLSVFMDNTTEDKAADDKDMNDIEKNILKGLADDVTVCAYPSYAELVVINKLP